MIGNPPADDREPRPAPVTEAGRLVALDVIRGVAVLGILLANIVAMAYPLLAYQWPAAMRHAPGARDAALWLAQYVLIDGKMRGLFSLLFGAGICLFLERAGEGGQWLQARRLLWLALFGLGHFFLLFWGDILFLYAIAGLAALAMAGWRRETQLRFGIVWYLTGSLLYAAIQFPAMRLEQSEPARLAAPLEWAKTAQNWTERVKAAEEERQAFTRGSYAAETGYVAARQSPMLAFYPFYALLETIPLMLIGMGLYRYGLFSGGIDPGRQRWWGWAGLLAGTAMALALGLWAAGKGFPPFLTEFVFDGGGQGPRLPAIIGLAALLALWAPRAAGGWLGQRLAAAGRMAFSNYVGSSLAVMLVMRHWAGGLWGGLDRLELWGVALGVWVLILAWSRPWLARFRHGPLEWLWRCLTYGRLLPLRR